MAKCGDLWELRRWAQGLSCGGRLGKGKEPYGPSFITSASESRDSDRSKKRDLKGKSLCLVRDLSSLKFVWDRFHF